MTPPKLGSTVPPAVSASRDGHVPPPPVAVHWSTAVLWYAGTIIVGTLGAWLAYNVITSTEWQGWSGRLAWVRDAIRLSVTSLFSLFALWGLEGIRRDAMPLSFPRVPRWCIGFAGFVVLVLAILVPTALAPSFVDGLAERGVRVDQLRLWPDVYRPYVPYFFYMVAIWLGMAFPLLVVLYTRIPWDLHQYRLARKRLTTTGAELKATVGPSPIQRHLLAFQDATVSLKRMAEQYVPVLLVVALNLGLEQLTPSRASATEAAVDIGKTAIWFIFGPALFICFFVIVVGYQNLVRSSEKTLADAARTPGAVDDGGFDVLFPAREALVWDRTPLTFLMSVVKSANIAVPLIFGLTIYVLDTLADGTSWLGVFLPQALIDWFTNLYEVR